MKPINKIRLKLYLSRIITYLLIFSAIFAYGIIINKLGETCIILFLYTLLRWCYPTTWHSRYVLNCIVYSVIIFGICQTLCMPIKISILSGVALSLVLTLLLYKLQVLIDNQIVIKSFNTNNCTEEELIKRCRELHFSDENTKLAIEFFIKKTKQSTIADNLCIEEKSVTMRKNRMKDKLNTENRH